MSTNEEIPLERILTIKYKNWKGKTSVRSIIPSGEIIFGSNQFHKEPQYLLKAKDVKYDTQTGKYFPDGVEKNFALKDIMEIYDN